MNDIKTVHVERILNFTKHTVTFLMPNGNTLVIPNSGVVRLANSRVIVERVVYEGQEIRVNKVSFGNAVGLPPEREGTIIIVSTLTAKAFKDRNDIYVVDEPVREGKNILGCRALAKGNEVT